MKILFTGGGTGGHITPIIAITREIRRASPQKNIQFFYIGPKDDFAAVLLSQEGIKTKSVSAGKIRRYVDLKSLPQNIIDVFFKVPLGVFQSLFYIFFLAPDLIFSRGGYGSIPAVIAGKLLFVPIFLHESDVVPGLANKFLSRFSLEIFVSFPKTEYFSLRKMVISGNPIRRELFGGSKEKAKEYFKLSLTKPVILVLGGSQGAQRINDKILAILPELLENFELIHQCGENNFKETKEEAKTMIHGKNLENFYHPFPFLKEPELKEALAASDLIVSRAGSGTIFEIAALEKPSILIPLPESAQNHQIKNAYAYAENGACLVLEEANFTSHFFLEKLKYLFLNQKELENMKIAARNFSKPMAAKIIANYLVEFLTK